MKLDFDIDSIRKNEIQDEYNLSHKNNPIKPNLKFLDNDNTEEIK